MIEIIFYVLAYLFMATLTRNFCKDIKTVKENFENGFDIFLGAMWPIVIPMIGFDYLSKIILKKIKGGKL